MPEDFSLIKDFAIIMAVAGAALVLFRRFGQPPILGYLLAGLIIGPFTLPDPPVENLGTIRRLADLGLVLLLFAIGLEFGWERIRRVGLKVVLIGGIEITFMMALGYEVGTLMGWSGTEAMFLGAALAISSSAILIKTLRDSDGLRQPYGRIIVGVLVVEDFAAVVLLAILSGVASTGTATLSDVAILIGKLGLFTTVAVVLGALFAPRIIDFVAKFQSQETLLIASLALCFGLALVAQELGISAAVGAFLIGTILGDTEHSGELGRIMAPVRDMFAALFFVSIGMLVDLSLFGEFIGPALVVSVVFILGKVIADTVGAFVAGLDGRSALKVGMGMPQMGEFSLAMVKVGSDFNIVGSFLYPVVTVTTAITSLAYPYVFGSTEAMANLLERRSPRALRQYVANLSLWLSTLQSTISLKGDVARDIQRASRFMLINLGIIVVLITVGTFLLQFTRQMAGPLPLGESVVGLIIGTSTLVLCIPPAIVLWRSLHTLSDGVSLYVLRRRTASGVWSRQNLRIVLRNSILVLMTTLVAIWSLPFISRLLLIGGLSTIASVLFLVALVLLAGRTAFRIHGTLEDTFERTILGEGDSAPEEDDE